LSENWLKEYASTLSPLPESYKLPEEDWLKTYLLEELQKDGAERGSYLAASGALPALGKVEPEQPTISPFSQAAESTLRALIPDFIEKQNEDEVPVGTFGAALDTAVMSAVQPFIGAAEEVGMLTPGTTQEIVQDIDKDRVAIAAMSDSPITQIALSGAAELAGGVAPGFGAAKGVMKAASVAGKSAKEAAKIAAKYGVPTEAMLQGYFSSAGVPWNERWKVMALSGAIGAGGGAMAVKAAGRLPDNLPKKPTPTDTTPPAREVSTSDSIQAIRTEAAELRNVEAAERFARVATGADVLDLGVDALRGEELPIEATTRDGGDKIDTIPSRLIEDLASREMTSPEAVKARVKAGAYAPMVPELRKAEAILARYETILRDGGESLTTTQIDELIESGIKGLGKAQANLNAATLALADVESRIQVETSLANDGSLTARVEASLSDAAQLFHKEKERILGNLDKEISAVRKFAEEELKRVKEFQEKHGDVAEPAGRDGKPLKSKFAQAEDVARARAEDLIAKAEQKYRESVDKITYDSPAAKELSKLFSARDKIRVDIELASKTIQTLEEGIAAAEKAINFDGVIARGAALGMSPGESIIDMVHRAADERLAQSLADEAEAQAFRALGIGKKDLLDMPIEKLVEMREKVQRDIEIMQNSKPYAEQLWERIRETSTDDSSAVARLRNNAALAEIFRKEDAGFDAMDSWYRERSYERNSLRPDTQGDSLPPRQAADSLSEFKDATFAVLEKVKNRASNEYRKLFKAKDQSLVLPDGNIISKEDYVANRVAGVREAIDSTYTTALSAMGKQSEQAVIRTIDSITDSMLRQHKIDKSTVGFRGGVFENARQLRSEAGVWMDQKLGGKGLSSLTDADMVDLAAKARDERAPDVVFEWLLAEQTRRAENRPSTPRISPSTDSPDTLVALADQRIRDRVGSAASRDLAGAERVNEEKLGIATRAGRRIERWARTMFASNRRLVPGKYWLLTVGSTTEDAVMDLASRSARGELRRRLDGVMSGRHIITEQLARIAAVADRDLTEAISGYIQRQRELGNNISEQQFRQQLYEARVTGTIDKIADPEFLKFYNEVFAPFHRDMQEKAGSLVSDPFDRAKITHEMDKYLHRRYAIYSVKDAAYKQIDTTTDAYRRYFRTRMVEDYDTLRTEAYKNHAQDLRGRGLNEDQISELIDMFVENRVHGEIEKLVRQGLNLHDRTFGKKVLGESDPDYLKQRQIEDNDLREILGEVKDIKYSAMSFAHGVAHDVGAFVLRADLMQAFREAGMLHDKPISGYAVPISSSTLKQIGDTGAYKAVDGERVLYTSPRVVSVLDAVSKAGDEWDRTFTRIVGRVKSGFVLTPRNAIQQAVGGPIMVVNSAGYRGVLKLLPWNLGKYIQASKELSFPGSAGVEKQNWITKVLGLRNKEEVRAMADELAKYGLTRGNEYAYEMEMSSRPSLVNPELRREGFWGAYDKTVHKLGQAWKIADVAARAIAWVSRVERVMANDGVSVPTERIKQEAAAYAKNTTQDPDTTPTIVRDLGRSLPTAGFQSWGYQMLRNISFTYGYALKDILTGIGHIKAGQAARGGRWIVSGIGQAATMTVTTFYMFNLFARRNEEEERQAAAAVDVLWRNKRNSRIALGSKIPGLEKPAFERVNGKIIMNYIDVTGLDIQSSTKRMLVSLAKSVENEDPSAFIEEFTTQYLQPSFFLTASMDLAGLEPGKTTATPQPRSTLGSEQHLMNIPVTGGTVTTQGIAKAVGRVAPGVARFAVDTMIDPALRKIAGPEAGIRRLDPQDPMQDRAKYQLLSQGTGIQAASVDYGKMLARRFNEEYNANAIWIGQMRREWQSANTWDARVKVINRYEKDWDKFYKSMTLRAENAYSTGAVNLIDMGRILGSKYGEDPITGEKGYKINGGINGRMRSALQYGMPLTLREYLYSLKKNQ